MQNYTVIVDTLPVCSHFCTKMLPKAACLVILCCCLMHMMIVGSDISFYHAVDKDGTFAFLASQSLVYLLYPLLGWLADVYFTRYKFILYSFITMILATFLMILAAALFVEFFEDRQLFIFVGFSISVCLNQLLFSLVWTRCWKPLQMSSAL